jgi:hypothetical protein
MMRGVANPLTVMAALAGMGMAAEEGIAFHQAILDACREFERKIPAAPHRAGRCRLTGEGR